MGRGFEPHGAYQTLGSLSPTKYTSGMSFPLHTDRLVISPLTLEDLSEFVRYRQDPLIARYQSWETSYSEAQGIALIKSQDGVTHPAKGEWLQLAIHSKLGDELVGDLALHSLADEEDCFELGFTISGRFQGQGYASEAATGLMRYLFEEQSARWIVASTDRRNAPSIRLLRRLGFELIPSKSWTEEFKNELVTVDSFRATRPASSK